MKKLSNSISDHAILRSKAEELLKKKQANKSSMLSEADSLKLIREIEVLQVELELQNDELKLALAAAHDAVELYDFTPSGCFTLTKDAEIIRLNLCGAQMLGKERSLLLNSKFAFFVSAETRSIFNSFLDKLFSSKIKETCEISITRNGNIPVYVLVSGIISENENNCFITLNDITDRRLAEEDLKKSRLLLKASVESQKDTILVSIDKDHRYLIFNKAHQDEIKILYNKNIELGMSIFECITSDADCKIVKENYDRALRGETHSDIRIFGNLKLAYYETFYNPICDENNEIIGVTALSRNITHRQAEEDALLNALALTDATFSSIDNGILAVTNKGKILKCNSKFAEMWRIPVDMLNVRDSKLLINSVLDQLADPEEVLAKVAELFNKPETESKDLIYFRDGRVFERISCPLYINGVPEGRVLSFLDITERIHTEEVIKASEERYQTFINSTDDIAFLKDEHLRYQMINNAAISFFGKKKEYIIGSTDFELMEQKLANQCLQSDKETLQKNTITISEEDVGECIYETRKFPVKLRNGAVGIGCYISDITERRKAETALRDAHKRMEGIIEGTQVGTWEWNVQTGKVVINDFWAEMIGYSLEELAPVSINTWKKFAHPDDLKKSDILLEKHFAGKLQYYDCECRMKHKDGHWVWILDRGRVITRTADGKPDMMFGTHTDITNHKRAQEELKMLNVELEQRVKQRTLQLENANKELEAFSYSVAHNLRSPLRGIDGWSMALAQDYNHLLDDQGRTYINRVRKEAQQMANLIDDLLKLAQVTHIGIQEINVDLSELVQTIVTQFTIAHKEWKFEFIIQPGLSVHGDISLIQIVLTNLIDNAFKFTGLKELARIEFGKTEIEGRQVYFIRDNGVGFDMAFAKKLFGPFQRLHKPSDFPGSGIGLATVQRIIARLGGRIWAEAKPGEGATFYFTLN